MKGDSEGINAIYHQNFPKVKNFILKNGGSAQDAEDVFQKALLQLAVRYKKEKFTIETSFDYFLFTVCKNLWRREINRSKPRVYYAPTQEPGDETYDQALALLEQKRWELFSDCFDQMTGNCRKVLKLYFSKVPYSEIMKKMNYSSETVARQRVFKCKARLKEIIRKDPRYNSLID